MNRFYVMVGVLAVVLGIGVFAMLRAGGGTAPAAAAGAPPTVVDDSFHIRHHSDADDHRSADQHG